MVPYQPKYQINALWKKAGVYSENPPPKKIILCNMFQKSGPTTVAEHSGGEKSVLSLLDIPKLLQRSFTKSSKEEYGR